MSDTQGAQLDPSMNVGLTGGAFINPAYSTPAQRAQLYAYANELMKPQPVKTGWQGLAEIARALVGGYEGHQADISEQASRHLDANQAAAVAGQAFSPPSQAGEAPSMPATPPAGPSEAPSPSADNGPIPNAVSAYVAQSAAQRGIDPAVATKVFGTESGFNPAIPGDGNSSFGVAQLHYGGISKDAPHPGLGDAFTAATGLDARDPKTWKQQVDFALDQAKEHGWQPWATTRDKLGIGNFTGIGKGQPAAPASNATGLGAASPNAGPLASAAAIPAPASLGGGASAFAPPPASAGPAPAVQAIGAALTARKPVQVAQNAPNGLPVSAQAIGQFLANPNIDPGVKHQAMEVLAPKMYQSATGQVLPSFQNQPVAPPIANLGVANQINPQAPTATAITTGPATAPQTNVAVPTVPGAAPGDGGAALANLNSPTGPFGASIRQGQENTAQAGVIAAKAAANQARFQQVQDEGPKLLSAAYPLRQLQAVLEKNGGVVPTGHGSEDVMNIASVGNMIATMLGHPLTDEDSKLTSLELMRKYGTQVAMSITGHPTDLGLQAAEATSPGVGLSPQANMHLVDNYIRLNALAQKKAQFEHDYYLSHGQGPNAYDNFTADWMKEISGPKAIPLSKFGRDVTLKDGTPAVYVPSTDPKGFSLFRKDDPAFDASVMTPGNNP